MTKTVDELGYDVVVLGGGVAGCVLASRLSEDPERSVCLVEAGPDYGPDPQAWPPQIRDARLLPRDAVWEKDSVSYRIRAKLLGGSSCINGCWHTWGAAEDCEEWARLGGPDWSATALEPFRQLAARQMRLRPIPDSELSLWSSSALGAARELGYPEIEDMAALSAGPGYGRPPINAIGDFRWNVAFAYLDPARLRPNLRILADTLVNRLMIRGTNVQGVEVLVKGKRTILTADSYILAAGAFGSPAVLMRSGIGPAEHLAQLDIRTEIDLPGVGANLVDHPRLNLPLAPTDTLNQALQEKEAAGGLYGSQVAIRAASGFCAADSWDLHLLPTAGDPLFGTLPPGHYEVGIGVFLMKPASRGRVRLRSVEPTAALDIAPAMLSDQEGRDLAVGRMGLDLAHELAASAALRSLAQPVEGHGSGKLSDDALRLQVGTYWHPVGTCALGAAHDRDGVTDGEGRVRGVDNLRVIDASVLPTIPRANTQLPVLAMTEMLARRFVENH
jgi:choline dehydrogenase